MQRVSVTFDQYTRARLRGMLRNVLSFMLLFTVFFIFLPVKPTHAQENVWRLTETIINPQNEKLEWHGGGSDPAYYAEERYKGKFVKYTVTETSFSIEDRWVDGGEEWYHITFDYTFDAPPAVLVPGESYSLKMDFSHGGQVTKGNPFSFFSYSSPSVAIGSEKPLPDNTLRNFPWAENPSSVSSMTWILTPPAIGSETIRAGATFVVYAGSETPACKVMWIYRADSTAPNATPTTSETSEEDAGTRVFTDDEFERMKSDVASHATNYWGDDFQKDLLKEGFIGLIIHTVGDCSVYDYTGRQMKAGMPRVAMKTFAEVQPIRIGDTIKTGEGSAKVVIFPRYKTDLSVIRIGTNSEAVFTRFGTADQDISVSQTLMEMVRGWVRVYIQNWARGAFDVRVGTTLIGIRGSDVFILYNPEGDIVAASVCEGHMDVTSTRTDQTVSLTDGQIVVVSGGAFNPILPMTQQDWDEMVGKASVEDIAPLSAEDIDLLLQQNMQPVMPTEPGQKRVGSGLLTLIIVLVVIAAAAVITGICLLIRARKKSHVRMRLPNSTSQPSPGSCSHCGSAISQNSIFCKKCGSRL